MDLSVKKTDLFPLLNLKFFRMEIMILTFALPFLKKFSQLLCNNYGPKSFWLKDFFWNLTWLLLVLLALRELPPKKLHGTQLELFQELLYQLFLVLHFYLVVNLKKKLLWILMLWMLCRESQNLGLWPFLMEELYKVQSLKLGKEKLKMLLQLKQLY